MKSLFLLIWLIFHHIQWNFFGFKAFIVYMPTSEYEDDEVEKLYDTIEEILGEDGKGDTNNIILGGWNSVVGDEPYRNIVGSHGLGRRNHRCQMFVDFCERNGLIVTKT